MNKETVFGGGCFWGIENKFQSLKGILETEVGYAGGTKQNPTYEEVCGKKTNHAEVVKIVFDETIISYEEILDFFFEISTLDSVGDLFWKFSKEEPPPFF